jgi:hypothetical protein
VLKATNEKDKKDEILRISMLIQKGNHLHNLEVVRQKRGYLVVARANTKYTNHSWNEFLPCAFCKSWILKHLFTKHRQFCNFFKLATSDEHFQSKMSHLKLSKVVFNEEMDKLGARLSAPKSAPEIKKRYYNGTVFSEKETNLIIEYFQFFINNKITPRKGQILPFIIENNFENVSWTWRDIKTKIVTKIYNEKKKEEILERRKEKKLVPSVAQEVNSESVSKIYEGQENLENIEYYKDECISNRDNKYDTKLEVTETLPKPILFADSKGNFASNKENSCENNEIKADSLFMKDDFVQIVVVDPIEINKTGEKNKRLEPKLENKSISNAIHPLSNVKNNLIFQYFKHFIDNGIQPRKREIKTFMTEHDIRDMTWTDIKCKVKSKITLAIKKKETKEQKIERRLRLKEKQDGEISKMKAKIGSNISL